MHKGRERFLREGVPDHVKDKTEYEYMVGTPQGGEMVVLEV